MVRHGSKQVRIQVRLHALAGLAMWLLPQLALSWAEAPACGFPNFAVAETVVEADESMGLCSLGAPHLLRNPALDICLSMTGRDAPADAPKVAERSLARARKLAADGLYEEALLNLRVVEATLPRIADHVAFMRAALHEQFEDYGRAAEAYRQAVVETPSIELRARARVARVRSLLRAGAADAEQELGALLDRYPELPEAASLRLALGRHRETTGQLRSALSIYRSIDLTVPGYPMAAEARERIAVLAGQGVTAQPFSEDELLERAARLMRSGPIEQARATMMELRQKSFSRALVGKRDALLQSFDQIEHRRFARIDEPLERAPYDVAFEKFKKHYKTRAGERQLEKLKSPQLLFFTQLAAGAQNTELTDVLMAELSRRLRSSSPELRFDALTAAIGTASDTQIVRLADTLLTTATLAVPARYHRARALERLGKHAEAKRELSRVMDLDVSATRFYATWAAQRLRQIEGDDRPCYGAGRSVGCNRAAIDATLRELEKPQPRDVARALAGIVLVETQHGKAYPWLSRALDLVRIGELEGASDELHEAYLAWRNAARLGGLRAGTEAVYRGESVGGAALDPETLRARRALDVGARAQLAESATALGDWGLAVNFGGLGFAEQQAMPYADAVARAARKYQLDPDLLFAVMRVESVYQKRIISHAGAIGLMQIMPRTGRLIADKLGQPQVTATDLLDPHTNIEFSAWYLSSLLSRMDGRLPLAIASYNGGPHNVRAWIRRYGTHVPLDAFLERIPFTETKRYVRRVLGYYASYKARRGQQVDAMAIHLPSEDRPGEVAF